MVSWREFRLLVKRLKYKPHWKFSAYVLNDMHCLDIEARVTNAYDVTRYITIRLARVMPDNLPNTEAAARWIKDQIIKLELHEVDEFLKVSGKHVTEPHPEIEALY